MESVEKVTKYYHITKEVSFDDAARIVQIAKKCGKIMAIWCVRNIYNLGLKESKDFVDSLIGD